MASEARPGPFALRAAAAGGAWGATAGAAEAVWHLHSWQLYTDAGDALQFLARAVLYTASYFALWTTLACVSLLVVPRLRRWIAAKDRAAGDPAILGALVSGAVVLYGVVTWRVGYHINDGWTSPALLGGILGAFVLAAIAGAGVGLAGSRWMARTRRLWLVPTPLLALLCVAAPLSVTSSGASDEPTRVLLITLDTFRADRIGAAGGSVDTPHLDALARRGVLFEQAVAQAPITCPAHLALLSSTPPTTNGVFANGTRIPADLALLQEGFQARGVPTAAFVAGYPVTSRFGFDRGFDVFDDDFGAALGDHRITVRRLVDQAIYARGTPRERTADAVLDRARPWLERNAEGGFFCWIHLFDPHGPYEAQGDFLESIAGPLPDAVEGPEMPGYWPRRYRAVADTDYWVLRYDEEIAYTDDRVGALLAVLEGAGVLDETVVAVVADHGESLVEHEYYFEHGLHLYDASLRIPMLMAGPGIRAGSRIPCQVRGMDLAPTVLDLVDAPAPESFEGESLRPLWESGCPDGVRLSVAATVEPPWLEHPGAELALRSDGEMRFKYVQRRRSDDELYDLVADPGETTDVTATQADVGAWMVQELTRIAEGMVEQAPTLSDDVRAQLEALGYIIDEPSAAPADDDSGEERGEP